MSNGSSVLAWTIAGVAAVVAAGALGFMAGRYSAETAAPPPAPAQQQAQPAQQQQPQLPPGTTTETLGDWTLFCQDIPNGKKSCFAMQEALNENGKVMLAVMAGYDGQANRTLLVRAPLGVQIDTGVEFAMGDKKPEAFSFSACNQVSCDAVLVVSDEGFKQLTDAGKFELAYNIGGKRLTASISMKGLTEAYTKIEKPPPPPAEEAAPAKPAADEAKPAAEPAPEPKTP